MGIKVVNAGKMHEAILSVVNSTGRGNLIVEKFYVHDFCNLWFELHREKTRSSRVGGIATPMLTERLTRKGLKVGDEVLVARTEGLDDELSVRVVAPLAEENAFLIGRVFARVEQSNRTLDLITDAINISVMVADASSDQSAWGIPLGGHLTPYEPDERVGQGSNNGGMSWY